MQRHFRDIARLAGGFGRHLDYGGKHMRLIDDTGRASDIIASSTPRCRHAALERIRRDLKRAAYLADSIPISAENSDWTGKAERNQSAIRNAPLRGGAV